MYLSMFVNVYFLYYNKGMDKQTTPEQKISEKQVEKYEDPSGLSLKKLRLGLWYLEHRHQLYYVLIGFLILISAVSWLYAIYNIVNYVFWGMKEDQAMLKELTRPNNFRQYVLLNSPQALQIEEPLVLKSDLKTDLVAKVTNVNPSHRADFDYYFLIDNGETAHRNGFILPGETKYFMVLAQETGVLSNAQLVLNNLHWQRLNKHLIPDPASFINNRRNINISEAEFLPASSSGLSEKISLNLLKFNATNNSAYSFWEVKFTIILHGSYGVMGVNEYKINEFMSGQKRKIEISWPGLLPAVDRIEIMPEIDIMDEHVYIKPEGGEGREK